MYETLFQIEAALKSLADLAAKNPLLVSATDSGTLNEILARVVKRADRAVQVGGAVRPE